MPRTGEKLFYGKQNSSVHMKNAVLNFMNQKMKINPVRVGFLAAFMAEFLVQQQMLTAVFASFFFLDHGVSFIKIIHSILIFPEF